MSMDEVPMRTSVSSDEWENVDEDLITDEDLKLALEEVEFDQMIRKELESSKNDIHETQQQNPELEQQLKKLTERILILAKDKTLSNLKLKRIESARN